MFKKVVTEQYPFEKLPTAPRFHGRHQLNRWPDGLEKCIGCELCAWACPADAIYVEGASQHRRRTDRAVQPGRALRPRLPDQLPALHPVRAVHRGLPDPGAHDDQRVRAGRRQPRRPDLREVRPARPAAAGHGAAAAPDAARRRRGRLLPRRLPSRRRARPARRRHRRRRVGGPPSDRVLDPRADHGDRRARHPLRPQGRARRAAAGRGDDQPGGAVRRPWTRRSSSRCRSSSTPARS